VLCANCRLISSAGDHLWGLSRAWLSVIRKESLFCPTSNITINKWQFQFCIPFRDTGDSVSLQCNILLISLHGCRWDEIILSLLALNKRCYPCSLLLNSIRYKNRRNEILTSLLSLTAQVNTKNFPSTPLCSFMTLLSAANTRKSHKIPGSQNCVEVVFWPPKLWPYNQKSVMVLFLHSLTQCNYDPRWPQQNPRLSLLTYSMEQSPFIEANWICS
jgi:hypothetical protein